MYQKVVYETSSGRQITLHLIEDNRNKHAMTLEPETMAMLSSLSMSLATKHLPIYFDIGLAYFGERRKECITEIINEYTAYHTHLFRSRSMEFNQIDFKQVLYTEYRRIVYSQWWEMDEGKYSTRPVECLRKWLTKYCLEQTYPKEELEWIGRMVEYRIQLGSVSVPFAKDFGEFVEDMYASVTNQDSDMNLEYYLSKLVTAFNGVEGVSTDNLSIQIGKYLPPVLDATIDDYGREWATHVRRVYSIHQKGDCLSWLTNAYLLSVLLRERESIVMLDSGSLAKLQLLLQQLNLSITQVSSHIEPPLDNVPDGVITFGNKDDQYKWVDGHDIDFMEWDTKWYLVHGRLPIGEVNYRRDRLLVSEFDMYYHSSCSQDQVSVCKRDWGEYKDLGTYWESLQ